MITRRDFLSQSMGAGLGLFLLPGVGECQPLKSSSFWWYRYPSFAQIDDPTAFAATSARMDIHGVVNDPTWGPYARRLSELDGWKHYEALKAAGARVITWIEGFGDCMLYAVALERKEDGSFVRRTDDPTAAQVMRSHWSWENREIPQGNTFRWVGLHNALNDEDFILPTYSRLEQGLPIPTYPDGHKADGWLDNVPYPLNAQIYDACCAKDINGSLHPAFEAPAKVNDVDAATGKRAGPVEGLYPAIPGKDDVAPVQGLKPGEMIYCGVISIHKDLSAPFWPEYARLSVREIVKRGLDGVWCDNYSPWDNFGYPPVQKAFGDWSVYRFHEYLEQLKRDGHYSSVPPDPFDVRTYLKAKAATFGAKDPSRYDDPAWRDTSWLDDPIWNAFKAFRQASAQQDLSLFYKAIHQEANRAGRPDFCIGGNDIPVFGLGWVRDSYLDMVNTETTPGWHMGTGSKGIGIPPAGKMAVVYRAALEHQKGPFSAAWYYLNGAYAVHQGKPEIARVLLAEAFANGAFLMCNPANKEVAGSAEVHRWWNQFVRENEERFGQRVPMADTGILFSPDNQLALMTPGGFPDIDHQPHIFGHYGWATALIDLHIPYRAITDWKLDASTLSRLRCLILPDAECLDDLALDVLEAWVRGGGRLVLTGEAGSRHGPSRHFRRREQSLFRGWQGHQDGVPSAREVQHGQGRIIRTTDNPGMEYYLHPDRRVDLRAGMQGMVGASRLVHAPELPAAVGLSLWRSQDSRTQFIDLVNYNLDPDTDRLQAAQNLDFWVRLPDHWTSLTASTLSPDSIPPAVAAVEKGWAQVRLERLEHYASVRLVSG